MDIVRFLEEQKIVPTAMIDVSDGLSSEIHHICKQSNCGALIYEDSIPIHPEAYEQALKFNLDPSVCALNGGEDYELLFTVPESAAEKIGENPAISVIGKIMPKENGVFLKTRNDNLFRLEAQGWNSFDNQ